MTRARWLRDRRGATVVEFALVLPMLLIALFGLLEGARLVWTTQALSQAAYATARCRMIGASACDTSAKQVAFAVQRARDNGVAVIAANVSIDGAAACRGTTGAVLVSIRSSFASPASRLLRFPAMAEGVTCLPALPSA